MSSDDTPADYPNVIPQPEAVKLNYGPGVSPQQLEALPEGCEYRRAIMPSMIGVYDDRDLVIVLSADRETFLNTAYALHDGDPKLPPHSRDYVNDPVNSVRAAERLFYSGFKSSRGILKDMHYYLRQLGVYHGWIAFEDWTGFGRDMLTAVARLEADATNILRNTLHAEAVQRKEQEKLSGLERQRLWNENMAEAARKRREELDREKEEKKAQKVAWRASKAQAIAAVDISETEWRPGHIPVITWLAPEAAPAFQTLVAEFKKAVGT